MSDDERAILEQRARALARPREAGRHTRASTPFAMFERAGVTYALDSRFVFEVSRVLAPTPLPLSEPHWLGITSLHGELLALVDLAVLLGHATSTATEGELGEQDPELADRRSWLVLVVGTDRREFGLRVDVVLEARPLSERLARAPASDPTSQLLVGTTAEDVRVLRGEALLSDPRLYMKANLSSEA
jgi:purine-binding chemotaxis protein CheW